MTALLFDALGTLFDRAPLADALGGADRLEAWFERLLHSAATVTMLGSWVPLQELAPATLETTAAQLGFEVDAQAVAELLSSLPLYLDAREALELARGRGNRVAVLSNGGRESTEKLLRSAGVRDLVDDVFGVDEVEAYKPDPRPYRLAVERLGASPQEVVLVAAHAWDVLGALGAGLRAVWVDRGERVWPFPHAAPPARAPDLLAAVRAS